MKLSKLVCSVFFAIATSKAKATETCPALGDTTAVAPGSDYSLGRGKLVQIDGTELIETNVSLECIQQLAQHYTQIFDYYPDDASAFTEDANGCSYACRLQQAELYDEPNNGACSNANHPSNNDSRFHEGSSWNGSTNTCTCYLSDDGSGASAFLRTDSGDEEYGCTRCENCILGSSCSGDIEVSVQYPGIWTSDNFSCLADSESIIKAAIQAPLQEHYCENPLVLPPVQDGCACQVEVNKVTINGCGSGTTPTIEAEFNVEITFEFEKVNAVMAEIAADGTLFFLSTLAGLLGGIFLSFADFAEKVNSYNGLSAAVITDAANAQQTYEFQDWISEAMEELRRWSESPSSHPSSNPSELPSSQPSESPSDQPSSNPSELPSSQPSESPSDHPSEHPSESPSCTPSISPTEADAIYLYYADWSPGENGCKSDGNEPNYMSANPSNYLYSTLDKCCTTHFDWNYLACMGQLDKVCARSLWYPDWSGADKGCLDDGNEPAYMTDNPTYYMYANKIDCCEQHYNWMYTECVGAKRTASAGLYYPDFDSSDHICRNDGLQPMYMEQSPRWWMHDNLKSCCTTNYSWDYEKCIKSDPNAAPVANPDVDGKYFPDWLDNKHVCRNDGSQPPYMTKNPSLWMYDTLEDCCQSHYNWNYDACMGQTSGGNGSGVWFKNDAGNCVESDTGSGVHDEWDTTYTTKKKCCAGALWWDEDCEDR